MSGETPIPVLGPEVLRQCYDEAAQAYPEECCGLLSGPADAALCDEVRPCKNEQDMLHALDPQTYPRDARTAYSLGPKDVLFLERSMGGPRPVKIIYHSHVDVGAYFSAEDQRAALALGDTPLYPVDYLVIDAGPAGVRGAKLFRYRGGAFVSVAEYPAGS